MNLKETLKLEAINRTKERCFLNKRKTLKQKISEHRDAHRQAMALQFGQSNNGALS